MLSNCHLLTVSSSQESRPAGAAGGWRPGDSPCEGGEPRLRVFFTPSPPPTAFCVTPVFHDTVPSHYTTGTPSHGPASSWTQPTADPRVASHWWSTHTNRPLSPLLTSTLSLAPPSPTWELQLQVEPQGSNPYPRSGPPPTAEKWLTTTTIFHTPPARPQKGARPAKAVASSPPSLGGLGNNREPTLSLKLRSDPGSCMPLLWRTHIYVYIYIIMSYIIYHISIHKP